jgi:hypothetical protein
MENFKFSQIVIWNMKDMIGLSILGLIIVFVAILLLIAKIKGGNNE